MREPKKHGPRREILPPHLQNIPVRSELGKKLRAAFNPPSGRVLSSINYSGLEMRIATHYASAFETAKKKDGT